MRVRRTHIAAARRSLLKDDDRIDAETAKVLIRVEYEIWGAHIDTPLLSVAAALRSKGWKTIPTKSKPVGHNKKMITVGAEAAPTIVKTFRMPEGFLVIGQEVTRTKPNPKAVYSETDGNFWGVEGDSTATGGASSFPNASLSTVSVASTAPASSSGGKTAPRRNGGAEPQRNRIAGRGRTRS